MMYRTLLFAVAAFAAGPATASTPAADLVQTPSAAPILSGDFNTASQMLWGAVGKGDRRPQTLLNLAAVQVGRHDMDDARALYDIVLSQPNIDVVTAVGTTSSHDIARRGLARLEH